MNAGPRYPGIPRTYDVPTSGAWALYHAEGDTYIGSQGFESTPMGDDEWSRAGRNGDGGIGSAYRLRAHYNYGGGQKCDKWPAVTLVATFPHDRMDLREEFVERVKQFVDQFATEKGLI